MAAQGVCPSHEIELVIDHQTSTTTTSSTNINTNTKHSNNNSLSTMIVAKRSSLNCVLTKFHAGYFRISLSLGGQALLWKAFTEPINAEETSNTVEHVRSMLHPTGFLVLWSLALSILLLLSLVYVLRCLFYFKMVKAEFLHHVGVNYLFAPSISWLLLLQSAPFVAPKTLSYLLLWWLFAVPVVVLDVKIYGQWFTKGKRFLSTVANPTSQLSVIGNLVGAQAAAHMGWRETAVCLFSLGMVHYLVLFVTLYQRLSGGDRLPVLLRPVFFLFFAAPGVASLAWESIVGHFDTASKMLFFLSLFLFTALVINLFHHFIYSFFHLNTTPMLFKRSMRRFNVAWWAYSFPVTVLAIASTEYAHQVKASIADILMLILSALSVFVSLALTLFTLLNSNMLLPDNDPTATLLIHLPTPQYS
ncbi:S-type anion channel SLAH4-like [Senna tora]|uniref:S-type anion channel SLAH4-like n=1 Tax=Senna tora TaxID=362788 RepID=A0A834WRM8_9FABA|nr:S-type anion channel SLAH4-like [Senna tora]